VVHPGQGDTSPIGQQCRQPLDGLAEKGSAGGAVPTKDHERGLADTARLSLTERPFLDRAGLIPEEESRLLHGSPPCARPQPTLEQLAIVIASNSPHEGVKRGFMIAAGERAHRRADHRSHELMIGWALKGTAGGWLEEHQTAHRIGTVDGQLQADQAAAGMAHEVDTAQVEGVDESRAMAGVVFDGDVSGGWVGKYVPGPTEAEDSEPVEFRSPADREEPVAEQARVDEQDGLAGPALFVRDSHAAVQRQSRLVFHRYHTPPIGPSDR
jgi:hypothetical protein